MLSCRTCEYVTEGSFHLGERALRKSRPYVLGIIHLQQPEAEG